MARFNKLDVPYQWKDEFTKYPHGYTIFEALCKWTKQVDEMVDNQNKWNEYLDNFVETFEFELQKEVQSTITRWQNEGLLDDIIASALNTELDKVKAQLAETVTLIKPTMTREEIQNLLYAGKVFKFLAGEYILDFSPVITIPTCLDIPSNVSITFEPGAVLKCIPNSYERYNILLINRKENVKIENGVLIGDRDEHIGTTGEWGYGVAICGSKNIRIKNTQVKNCWGDGFIVRDDMYGNADNNKRWYSENITLEDCVSDNNRRQGLSIISCKNLHVLRGEYKNTNGTAPECGIDIEPHPNPLDVPSGSLGPIIEGLLIENVTTKNNNNHGINVNLRNLTNSDKTVSIKIVNHTDEGSDRGITFQNTLGKLNGEIIIDKPYLNQSKRSGIWFISWASDAPHVKIINPIIKDANRSQGKSIPYDSAIIIMKDSTATYDEPVGNVTIEEPVIINTTSIKPPRAFYIEDRTGLNSIEKINIVNPIELDGLDSHCCFRGNIIDKNGTMTKNIGNDSLAVRLKPYYRKYINPDATGLKTLTLSDDLIAEGPEITFENQNSNGLQIKPPTGASILPIGGVDQSLKTNQIGSKLTIRKIDDTTFFITEMIGTFTAV